MGPLYLWNTISDGKEEFKPLESDSVRMYVCGPTVYNDIHIGNARPIVVFDLLYRLLKQCYKEVRYVRNITDIDDKIIDRAAAENCDINALAERYAQSFHSDIEQLGVCQPTEEPRATQYIEEMITMVERLIDQGFAYVSEGNVLFEVSKMQNYGKLSNRSVDELQAGARVAVADYKKDPADFNLWKPSAADEIGWDSPWGRGRPGWHLECSVMAAHCLGETIDIHGGGKDLIFPHHENEIAQSECCSGKPFANYWVHNGYITVDGSKMSKSEGNFRVLKDILDNHPGEAVRLALLTAHYKKPLDWTDELVTVARHTLDRWYRLIEELPSDQPVGTPDAEYAASLYDNLNTPQAITALHRLASEAQQAEGTERLSIIANLKASGALIGMLEQDPIAWSRWQSARQANQADALSDAAIEQLIAQRDAARRDKDFATADTIRNQLQEAGIVLEDKGDTTVWNRSK